MPHFETYMLLSGPFGYAAAICILFVVSFKYTSSTIEMIMETTPEITMIHRSVFNALKAEP